MKQSKQIVVKITLLIMLLSVTLVASGQGQPIPDAARKDNRVTIWHRVVSVAGLNEMLYANGPFTSLAWTDAAFSSVPQATQNQLLTNTGFARRVVLANMFKGTLNPEDINGSLETGLGSWVNAKNVGGTAVFANSVEGIRKFPAGNGMVYVTDGVLSDNGGVLGGTSPGSAGDPNAPLQGNNEVVNTPNQNNAFVPGGRQAYRYAIQRESQSCKMMTWTVLGQGGGAVTVGADHFTNPYRGDTSCYTELPLLCVAGPNYGGQIKATGYVQGSEMTSLEAANNICARYFGDGWKLLEHHHQGGWEVNLSGSLPLHTRFWVRIGNQYANAWDSQVPYVNGNGTQSGPTQFEPVNEPYRMPEWEGRAAGRSYCKVQTWVVMRQYNGIVQIGSDARTNPYTGDTSCNESLHRLCIQAGSVPPPPSARGHDYTQGWSGSRVAVIGPYQMSLDTTIDDASKRCRERYGLGWRAANFHDGALGPQGTTGWNMWAVDGGVYARDGRIAVDIGDQRANSYDG